MEQTTFIIAIVAFAISLIVFISGIFKSNLKGYLQSKTAKTAFLFFIIYIVSFVTYILISN